MPRNSGIEVRNNFVKGLLTENTGLNFPEDACTDTDNCVFKRNGTVTRRKGFDLEDNYAEFTKTMSGNAVATYMWKNVAGEGDLYFVVTQVGNNLYFYRVSDGALSANKHADTIDLTSFCPSGITSVSTIECQFTSGNGILFVTNPNLTSFYVTYSVAGNSFSATAITIQIRDFEGDTTDANAIDARPATNLAGLSAAHRYNLENQGWSSTNLTAWDTARADMPSNCDVSWYFKNSSDAFDFSIVANKAVGNSPAPKGHFIYTAYNIKRSDNTSGATDNIIATERVSTCAFYAGRIFYAGLNSAGQNSKIFFSQVIESAAQYGKCYEANDPTAEELFDLLSTDGGVIDIHDAGAVLKMFAMHNSLIIFATNGVWMVTGSQGLGFVANDYSIQKISSVQNISHTSIVDVEGTPFWWTLDGIYTITSDPQTNNIRVVCISDDTIKTFFSDIPISSKSQARGVYDPFLKIVQWIYRSTDNTGEFSDQYIYDSILNFNVLTNAFYPWSVDTDDVQIRSVVDVRGIGGNFTAENVVNSATLVVDSSVQVVAFVAENSSINTVIKYFITYNDGAARVTFAENYKTTYLDWESFVTNGTTYDSFFESGYSVKGEGIKKFQNNYLNIFSVNEEDSSFLIRGQWNYGNTGNSGKWSTSQLIDLTAGDFTYKPKRVKIRGHGVACQIRVDNNSTDPFNIIGWSTFITGNQWI